MQQDPGTTASFDLTIRNGRISNADGTFVADIGVRGGVIVEIAQNLPPGREDVDAAGKWVLPGGIDSHTHIEQLSGMGVMCADDFYSGTVSAAFGGTTTIISFAAQHRKDRIPDVIADYSRRAREKAVIDYGFHLILANPDEQALKHDLPAVIESGITSLKVYMTYDQLKLDDYQLLDVLAVAGEHGAMVMLHAENHDMIRWVARRLLERGHTAPKFHAVSHDPLVESEATHRAIALSRLIDVPVLIVHVAGTETVDIIRKARHLGAQVYAESCPQYLFLEAKDSDQPGLEGAKFCCSPPPGDKASQEAVWAGFKDGTLGVYSSDHAPYRFDESGKLPKGDATTFKEMANGVPGIELRLPLLFSEGVMKGRISVEEFVALTATNHARMYGLAPRKGAIQVEADADIVIWDIERKTVVSAGILHDAVGYTPYEGREIQGWPVQVYSRGRCVVKDGALQVEKGSGQFIARSRPDPVVKRPDPTAQRKTFGNFIGLKSAALSK
ncbi:MULTISPECIES: dihydropyrimidinase [unclassified Achromobacter]|uniref:dihydropyrimidinase n=1 Tax=unclassified Achromobacter TaxID=2626865 RepID=UPI000B51D0FA|nr:MULTISPECIES: dihydropyrimidinase [unclassified Achromobacter]OWT68910.1 dihydropyrimidinase [Achromobacter sp. HZ28]OWT78527.1 dihydropyrimidinase [Achromobacter sp. HZ34]